MTSTVSDNILCCLYLLVWIITLIWYQYKNHAIDVGTAIIGSYVGYAFFSLLSINDSFFVIAYNPLKLFPYVYLYVMLMIALSPTIYHHLNLPNEIIDPNTRVLKITSVIIIVSALLLIPDIISNFGKGLLKLFVDSDAGNDAYLEQLESVEDSGSAIRNIPAIIFNALADLGVFFAFYFMTLKKKNYWLIIGLLISVLISILLTISQGLRGGVIISILTTIVGYLLFMRYMSHRIKRAFRVIGISIVIAIAFPLTAITMSRFGDYKVDVSGIMNWYIGQGSLYFNNYGLDAGGIRNGDRTMYLVKRMIDPDTPVNLYARRDKYNNLKIDDYYFYTFVGDFTIDYGPVVAFVIFVVFNFIVLLLIRPRDGTIQLYQMLLLYFTMCICMQGGMTLFYYSDFTGLRIVVTLMLYAYLRYHKLLLEKFPLLQSSESDDSKEQIENS